MKGGSDLLSLDPARYSIGQLQRAVRGEDPELGPPVAVALIARRGGGHVESELGEVLRDDRAARRARLMAVQELVKRATSAAARELRSATDVTSPQLRNAVLDGLTSLASRGQGAVGAWAGVDPTEPNPPTEVKTLGPPAGRQAARIVSRNPKKGEVEEAAAPLGESACLDVNRESVLVVECAGERFMFLPTVVDLHYPDKLFEAPLHLGYVAAFHPQESGRWTARFAVVAYPNSRHNALIVDVINRRGKSFYRGTATLAGGRVTFEFLAVDRPGATAVDVAGALHDGKLSFTRALSARRRASATEPTQLRRPGAAG